MIKHRLLPSALLNANGAERCFHDLFHQNARELAGEDKNEASCSPALRHRGGKEGGFSQGSGLSEFKKLVAHVGKYY